MTTLSFNSLPFVFSSFLSVLVVALVFGSCGFTLSAIPADSGGGGLVLFYGSTLDGDGMLTLWSGSNSSLGVFAPLAGSVDVSFGDCDSQDGCDDGDSYKLWKIDREGGVAVVKGDDVVSVGWLVKGGGVVVDNWVLTSVMAALSLQV